MHNMNTKPQIKVRKGTSEMVRTSMRHEDPRRPNKAKQKRKWKKEAHQYF